MKDELEEFREWQERINKELIDWTLRLGAIARDNTKTYSQAMNWLNKRRPDTPQSYRATAIETFNSAVIPGMFNEAREEIRNYALNRPIDKEVRKDD